MLSPSAAVEISPETLVAVEALLALVALATSPLDRRHRHETRGVGGTVQRLYTPSSFWSDGTSPTTKKFLAGLAP